MFFAEEDFKGFTIYMYCHASHICHVNKFLYAFIEPNSKETCYIRLSPLGEITEVVEIWVTNVKEGPWPVVLKISPRTNLATSC